MKNEHARWKGGAAMLLVLLAVLSGHRALAQGPLNNGGLNLGAIVPAGEVDSWTFSANIGDRIIVRVGEILQTNNFTPRLRLMNPLGTQQATASGALDTEVAVTATNSGTFTVMVDGVAANATGTYRLTLAKSPGAFTVTPGDQGGPMTNGSQHGGIIEVGDLDVWSFSANAGDSIVLRMGTTNAFNPWIRLFGPDGVMVASGFDSSVGIRDADLQTRATNSGAFTVVVGSYYAGGAGNYILSLAQTREAIVVSPGDQGGPMANGFQHTGFLEIGDVDAWSFPANIGDAIVLRMGTTNAFNPWIRLFGPDGVMVASGFDNSVGVREATLQIRATNSGAFTVVAGSGYLNGNGAYSLTLAKAPGAVVVAPGDEGGPMTNGFQHAGTLNLGDVDVWTFSANAGDGIVLRMGATGYNPNIRLFGPNGVMVGQATDSSVGVRDADLRVQATNTGIFTVVASSYYLNGNGNYILTLAKAPPGGAPPDSVVISPGDQGGPMTNGSQHRGFLETGDVDVWTFTANRGDGIVLRMGTTNYNPWIRLFGPDGAMVSQAVDGSVGVRDADLRVQATNSGTFTVVAGSWSQNGTGGYILTLARTPGTITVSPGDQGGPMTNGFQHTGFIDVGDLDMWSFTASRGDGIVLRMGSTGYNPWIRLFGPDGALITSVADGSVGVRDADLRVQATNDGTFTVVVGSWSQNGTGNYILTLAHIPEAITVSPGDEGGPMVSAFQHTGFINIGDLDVWSFTASRGDAIALRMGSTGYNPWIRLFGPDGALITSAADGSVGVRDVNLQVQATNSGTFTVVVSSWSQNGTGAYMLNLAHVPEAITLSPGDQGGPMTNAFQHTGSLEIGDMDVWSFSASAGDRILLRTGTTNYNPWLRLFGPNGVMVAQSFDGSVGVRDVNLQAQATNSGTFTVVASSWTQNGFGSYILTLVHVPEAITLSPGDQGGRMTNAFQHAGFLQIGDMDAWSFSANAGDAVVLRMGTVGFNPWLQVFGPNGTPVGQVADGSFGVRDGDLRIQATNSGIFTVVAGSLGQNGTGSYILTLAHVPEAITLSPGDQGGPIANGFQHSGFLEIGDIDVWSFPASVGNGIALRMGTTNGYSPWIRLFGPTGVLVAQGFDGSFGVRDAELRIQATNSGVFTVVVGSLGQNGTGHYILSLGRSPGTVFVSPGDEGGLMTNEMEYVGSLEVGDMDVYRFPVCRAVALRLVCEELTGAGAFSPRLRLFGPTGALLATAVNATTTVLNYRTTNSGSFTLIVDGGGQNNIGTYRLTGFGIAYDGLALCSPFVSGTTLDVTGLGGLPGADGILYTHTEVETPFNQWVPVSTNQFDQLGVFTYTNRFDRTERKRFFYLKQTGGISSE